ncbi:hypothetical protein LJB77_01115 [Ruminococcaceae bacterium OttesenSCG-928-N02]|nr:hypothetical protein [Ruminococcaceae bacterium OttesenSCG-928-N02]
MKRSNGMGVGANSILIIFVLLALLSFATLSLTTANADYNLARTAALATQNYYDADTAATQRLAEIDTALQACTTPGMSEGAYITAAANALGATDLCTLSTQNGMLFAQYTLAAGEGKDLQVELQITLQGTGRYDIVRWQTVRTNPWQPDASLPVLQLDE